MEAVGAKEPVCGYVALSTLESYENPGIFTNTQRQPVPGAFDLLPG